MQSAAQNPQSKCGDGEPGEDTDKDGLEDVTEYCLGTDPFSIDSDLDLITDTLEVEGFDWDGRHWTSDPFEADSNNDGLVDFSEWPAPDGEAPGWDPDDDGVPNLWDADNDDDGVSDYLDLSPFSHTGYDDTFSLSTQGGGFDGYQYIELHLQPQNLDHLRYSAAVLDWPHDGEGQLQDLDGSTEDLRLTPMLKIRANQAAETGLAQEYGVSTFEEDDKLYLYAPVVPVSDGGQIVAFYSKVAYGPGGLDDIRWEEIQLVWVVQMNVDHAVGDRVVTDPTLIHVYTGESFRITGLQIVKSTDSQSAILGTPGSPNDDQQLFNVLLGISATFLHNQTPDLQTIATRFDNPNTPIEETWGVPATDVTVEFHTYGHSDEGIADMAALIPGFLNDNGYPTDSTPSLVIAFQDEVGAYSLDDEGQLQLGSQINVNLADVHMSTQRSLKRASYTYQNDGWEAMTLEETLEMVLERYDDLSGTLATLQAEYPELTEEDLQGLLLMFYSIWYQGQTRIVAIDGQPLAPDNLSDLEVYDVLYQPVDGLSAYLIEAGDLAQPGGGLKIGNNQYESWAYQRDQDWEDRMMGFIGKENTFFDIGPALAAFGMEDDDKARFIANGFFKSWRAALNVVNVFQCAQWARMGQYRSLFGGWTGSSVRFGWGKWMKLSERKLGLAGVALMVGVIWLQFGLTSEEVYHQNAGGQWAGGWLVNLPDVAQPQTAWVFSDPLQADADNDGLDDFTERANSTSPYAYNDAPRLTLEADPLAVSPNDTVGVYVEPGDTAVFTLTLDSVGPRPVTSTLTLCLPDFLTDVQGGDLQGDRTPPRQPAPTCNGFQWSFDGQYTLQFWETVSITITCKVEAGLSASVSDKVVASLPYQVGDEPEDITTHVPVVVDVDDPQVTIVAPLDGDLLGGGISSYVMGGSANDATSWVTRVDLNLPGAGTVTAEGISPWATTWDLPADGVYDLTATSYDHLGHASPPATIQVTVDNTAPEVTLDLADGAYVTGQSGNVITVNLTGSASDNLSGLTRVQVSTDGKPWREVWAEGGYPLTADWNTDWTLPDEESAQGKHTVAVRAFDRAGNESVTLERTIVVDVVPPTDELTSRTCLSNPPHNPTGQPLTFHGVANDAGNVPQPSRPVELVGTLDGIDDATIWLGLSSIDENDAGVQVAWLGDFNGDRLADLAVGLPAAADGDGQVTVVYGRAGGWPVPSDLEMLAESRTSFVGKTGAGIGNSLAAAGDVDGDGRNDLLIDDAANDRVYLVFGRPSPMGRNLLLDEPQSAMWSAIDLTGLGNLSGLGAAGDVNGDGYDDLLIGVTGAEGKAYLLLGQPSPWWETVELDVHAAAQIEVSSSD